MTELLPIRRTRRFQRDLQTLIPKKNRENLIFDLERISKGDLRRYANLKGELLEPFRSYHKSNFRILFVYCSQCFQDFNHRLNCNGCDENDLERIILIDINHRSNAYRYNKSEISNFTLYDH